MSYLTVCKRTDNSNINIWNRLLFHYNKNEFKHQEEEKVEQLENIMLQPRTEYKINFEEYDNYSEHLAEEDDRRYEDEIFEELGGNEND